MAGDAEAPLIPPPLGHASWDLRSTFASSLAAVGVVALALFACFTEYEDEEVHVALYYPFFIHVMFMIFIGFGFLMTFLKKYPLSAVGFNFIMSCVVMLLAVLAVGGTQQGLMDGTFSTIKIDLPLLIDAAFAAGSAMIAFGAVLGRSSPGQLLWMLVIMVPIYAVNAWLVFDQFKALDIGGSMSIHAFGAYYGLAASRWIATMPGGGTGHPLNGAVAVADTTAMIGTIFLWVLWPSFNGALAAPPGGGDMGQWACVANTVLALIASCIASFVASAYYDGKFNMVHVQNATLAGGVAIGSSANLRLPPAAALTVGALAGLLSVTGYVKAQPVLERSVLSLRDTCGVHNLHGMPGVLGGLAAALFSALPTLTAVNDTVFERGPAQPLWQLAGLGVTLAMAMAGGTLAGWLVSTVGVVPQELTVRQLYNDKVWWVEEESEEGSEEGEEGHGAHCAHADGEAAAH